MSMPPLVITLLSNLCMYVCISLGVMLCSTKYCTFVDDISYNRMKSAEKQYLDAFEDELSGFKGRVRQRAKVRIEEATRAYEEEERQKRLGPGGLDPVEVMETLPQELQECFESKSVSKLQEVLSNMPKEEAAYHMKRCVDSGLWVPDAKAAGM